MLSNNKKTIFLGLTSVTIAFGSVLMGIIGITCSLVFYFSQSGMTLEAEAETYIHQFQTDSSPSSRLSSLAGLFKLGHRNPVYHDKALNLFKGLSHREQLDLFNPTTPQEAGDALVIVVENIYVTLKMAPNDSFNPSPLNTHQNKLLQLMASSLNRLVNQTALKQANEIEGWLGGRQYAMQQNYEAARDAYSAAIFINHNNPLTHYERALVFMALDDYDQALTDFNKAVQLDQSLLDDVLAVNLDNNRLNDYLWTNSGKYPYLARLITPPTATATAIPTLPAPIALPGHSRTPVPAEPAVAYIPGPATPIPDDRNVIPVDTLAPAARAESIDTFDNTASAPAPAVGNLQSTSPVTGTEEGLLLFLDVPPFVSIGGRIHITLTVKNTSEITATNMAITSTFPTDKVTFPGGFDPNNGIFDGMKTITWQHNDDLGPGKEATFSWVGTIIGEAANNDPIIITGALNSRVPNLQVPKEGFSYIRPVKLALSIEAPTVIKPGESLVYTLDVINVGEAAAFDIRVRASIDPNVVNPSHISDGGEFNAGLDEGAGGARQVIWRIDRLDPGNSRSLSWKGEVDPFITPLTTIVTSKAKVINPSITPVGTAEPTVKTRVYNQPVRPILNATLNSYPGGPYASSLTIQNTGHKVHRIVVTQPLPTCVQFPTNISHGGVFEGNHRIVWHLDSLDALETVNLTWDGTICLNTHGRHTITNTAVITIADVPQTTPIPAITFLQPVLLLNKTATGQAGPGETVTYTLTVETQGPTQNSDDNNFGVVVVRDPIPANIINPNSITPPGQVVGNEIIWELSNTNLEAAKPTTLTWTGTIDPLAPVGTEIVNAATANDEWGQLVTAEARTVVAPQSVSLYLSATGTITRGGTVTYTIKVQNTGQTKLFNINVLNLVPDHVLTPTLSSKNGGQFFEDSSSGKTPVTWELPQLDAGATVELIWTGTIDPDTPTEQTEIRSEATLTTASGLTAKAETGSILSP